MKNKRKSIPIDVRRLVLHEAGYRCVNPTCRTIITIDLHHLDFVSEGGENTAENLIALCPNCHSLHHKGHIPIESLRAWKMMLLSLNEGFDKKSIEILLSVNRIDLFVVSGDGLLSCSYLIASGMLQVDPVGPFVYGDTNYKYRIKLSEKGLKFLTAWQKGDQIGAIE